MGEIKVDIDVNNLNEEYIFNKVARQADGAVLYKIKNAILLAAVTVDNNEVEEEFLPLTVQYLERAYAAAKIPGGFVKREQKPGDYETLTARIVDRALRPLFPKSFRYPVFITIMVLSSDWEVDLQLAALHAANAALLTSSLPINKSVAGVRLARKEEGGFLINPTLSELKSNTLDLLVVGSDSDLMMIEMRTIPQEELKEIREDELIEALDVASEAIKRATNRYLEDLLPLKKELREDIVVNEIPNPLVPIIESRFKDKIKKALNSLTKSERSIEFEYLTKEIKEELEREGLEFTQDALEAAIYEVRGGIVKSLLLQGKRLDGRSFNEIRPISIETNLLPSVHGSALFTRGETQALVTVTIGDSKDGQMFELLTDKSVQNETFMVHYNFPPFSVGEAKPITAPSRRELGHGNLAKRALEAVVEKDSSQTIRVVSEILESNGSSSMATVCGGSLALKAANIKLKKMVAGVAMGLVIKGDEYAILTDIMGVEDMHGDMDFKVAGTKDGITALQMDIKVSGLKKEILNDAIKQAKEARVKILEIMEEASKDIKPSSALPKSEFFHIDPSKISLIIGRAGSTIKEIIEKFGVSIDLDRESGKVKVTGDDQESIEGAKEHIKRIATSDEREVPKYKIGATYHGVVKRIVDFGMFVELPGNYDALLHVSKLGDKSLSDFKVGDEIDVVVLDQKDKKIELATLDYVRENLI
ncbi:MAG: polyribonucleotide nucleotidyltransferase [Epsilonproteobacteria bacterium]|nr:polyribonucleotide nucleotidyltransferase [Campylobacterota bacterium]